MKNSFIKVVRWIGVLPISIIAMCLANLLLKNIIGRYFEEFFIGGNIGKVVDYIYLGYTYILVAGICGYCFVISGSYVAPSHKRIVSVVLATLMCLISIVSAILYITRYETMSMIGGVLSCVASGVGCIIGCSYIFEEFEENNI